ncbi:probable leucine-rich repeat receptor-like protein kinase [Tanacetum coccineum]
MKSLLNLNLSYNNLSGDTPQELGLLHGLLILDLSKNRLNGSLQRYIGDSVQIHHIYLSNNNLSGKIPSEIGKLSHLSVLDLSWNSLTKEIPSETGSFESLLIINLSHNKLSGSFPNGFSNLPRGINIDLSCNELIDPVPAYAVFLNVSGEALEGNRRLCGNITGLNLCESQKIKKKNNHFHHSLILVTMVTFFAALLLGVFMCGLIAYRRRDRTSPQEPSGEEGILNEVRALTSIRHKNIVKLYGYCYHAHHSFLIYEYLEKGSLKSLLSSDITAKEMDWLKRVTIVRAVANDLAYMHHDCTPPIIHRDISGANILLDSDYGAHISDFGTATRLKLDSSNWTTVVGTYGYIAPGDRRIPPPSSLVEKPAHSILNVSRECLNYNPQERPTMRQVTELLSVDDRLWMKMHVSVT